MTEEEKKIKRFTSLKDLLKQNPMSTEEEINNRAKELNIEFLADGFLMNTEEWRGLISFTPIAMTEEYESVLSMWMAGEKTESPIENILLGSLYNIFYGKRKYIIDAQVEVLNKYRVDFLIIDRENKKQPLIIECDGHNYHERTKEQAKKDNQRDRNCINAGYTVMRFTGSEIYNNVNKCVEDIKTYFNIKEVA